MSIADLERDVFGQALQPIDRVVAGLVVVAGGIGHAALGAAALLLFDVLLFGI